MNLDISVFIRMIMHLSQTSKPGQLTLWNLISPYQLPCVPHIFSGDCPYTWNLKRSICENLDRLLHQCIYWTMTGLMTLKHPQSLRDQCPGNRPVSQGCSTLSWKEGVHLPPTLGLDLHRAFISTHLCCYLWALL